MVKEKSEDSTVFQIVFHKKSFSFFVTGIDVLEVQIIEKTTLRNKSSISK